MDHSMTFDRHIIEHVVSGQAAVDCRFCQDAEEQEFRAELFRPREPEIPLDTVQLGRPT